jgi:outer membrane protein OmpA-like peptidoglycan-associated protein
MNRALSARRAEAVVAYIASKFNVAADRMRPVGLGSDNPVVPTPDQTPEPRNRRVQVVNIGS